VSSVGSMGWGGGELAVRLSLEPPAAFMDGPVMGPAHQGQVGQVGRAAIQPMLKMVGLTPGKRPLTAREDTAAVAHGQGGPLGGLDDPGGPADLQGWVGAPPRTGGRRLAAARSRSARFAWPWGSWWPWSPQPSSWRWWPVGVVEVGLGAGGLAGDQDPGDGAVTGQPLPPLGSQRPQLAVATQAAGAGLEAVQRHQHRQLGADPTRPGQPTGLQGPAGHLGQGIGPPLAAAAVIGGPGRPSQRLQRDQQALAGFGFQQPVQGDHTLQGRPQPQAPPGMAAFGLAGRWCRGR
jgi:hypothetical protein